MELYDPPVALTGHHDVDPRPPVERYPGGISPAIF
jgi:hypothetical protein